MIMKKVLIITTVSGFLLKFEKENAKILKEMGYELHYAANGFNQMYQYEENELEKLGVCFHHIDIEKSPFSFIRNFKALKQVCDLLRSLDIELIHCHTPMGGVLGRLAGSIYKKAKVIYTCHGYHFYKGGRRISNAVYRQLEKFLAGLTDAIILINREDYEKTLEFKLKNNGCAYLIPGIGLDLESFSPVTDNFRKEKRESLGIGFDKTFILSVGELNHNKNHRVVIEALKLMKKNGANIENIRYGICGTGSAEKKLKALIKSYDLEKNVSLYGYCNNVKEYIAAADFTVFPSEREGLGMAALESLASGVPVIASDNRGSREYMRNKENGLVCDVHDAESFAKAIVYMMELSSDERKKMRHNCIETAKAFDKNITNEIMQKIYRDI